MKPKLSKALRALFITVLLLTLFGPQHISFFTASSATRIPPGSELKFPGPDDQFIVYYNTWPIDDAFFRSMGSRYKLIILNLDDFKLPGKIPPDDYKKQRIKMLEDQGAMVFAYQSIGEENLQGNNDTAYPGDKLGPCKCDDAAKCCKKEVASYYIDDGKGKPAIHKGDGFVSEYVNAGNPTWRARMKQEARDKMALGCTGLFLDTLDTVTNKEFAWTRSGMMKLLADLNAVTPNIIVNRGIALLETPFADDYKRLSWAVMYEDFYTDWDGNQGVLLSEAEREASVKYWAPMLAGKNVLVVDFATCEQLAKNDKVVATQKKAVADLNVKTKPMWPNYIADHAFHETRYKFKCENKGTVSGER